MPTEKVIDRIKKLLSLATSNNEHEAANAAALAAKLMLEHEIAEAQLEEQEEPEEVTEEQTDESGKVVSWKATLQHGLAKSLGCTFFTGRRWNPATRKMVCRYMVIGQPSKVATIKYMYHYLMNEVDRLANKAFAECEQATSARAWKNAFRLGASDVICRRLIAQRAESHKKAKLDGQSQALAVVKTAENAVQLFKEKNYPNLRSGSSASFSSRSGFSAGKAAGRNINLSSTSKALGRGALQLK